MSYLVSNLKDSISGLLSGINLDNVLNANGAIERSARSLVQKADIPDAVHKEAITVYDGVYDYAIPSKIFGGALIDFRQQGVARNITDYVYKKPVEMFDRTKHILPSGAMITFEHDKGVGLARIVSAKVRGKVLLDSMADDDGWTVGTDASGLAVDETVFYESPASLRFNLSASGATGTLTRTINSVDMTEYDGVGVGFLALRIPSANLTSVELRVGSDASNYWSVTRTQAMLGAFKANAWQLVDFDLASATETGTVDASHIDYVQILLSYDGTAMTNVRAGHLFFSLPSPHEMLFQSAAIFQQAGADPELTIHDDNDEVLLNGSAFTLLELEASLEILLQSGGSLNDPAYLTIDKRLNDPLNGLYALYRADNPSEEIRQVGTWYN